jgi:hypothetical protein
MMTLKWPPTAIRKPNWGNVCMVGASSATKCYCKERWSCARQL